MVGLVTSRWTAGTTPQC